MAYCCDLSVGVGDAVRRGLLRGNDLAGLVDAADLVDAETGLDRECRRFRARLPFACRLPELDHDEPEFPVKTRQRDSERPPTESVSHQDIVRGLGSTRVAMHWMPGMRLPVGNSYARSRRGVPRRTETSFVRTGDSGEVTSCVAAPPSDQYPEGASNRPTLTLPYGTSIE